MSDKSLDTLFEAIASALDSRADPAHVAPEDESKRGWTNVALTSFRAAKKACGTPPYPFEEKDRERFASMRELPLARAFFALLTRMDAEELRDFTLGFLRAEDKVDFLDAQYSHLATPALEGQEMKGVMMSRRDLFRYGAMGVATVAAAGLAGKSMAAAMTSDEPSGWDYAQAVSGVGLAATGAATVVLELQQKARQQLPQLAKELEKALSTIFQPEVKAFEDTHASQAEHLLLKRENYDEFMSQVRRSLRVMLRPNQTCSELQRRELTGLMFLHALDRMAGMNPVLQFIEYGLSQKRGVVGRQAEALQIAKETSAAAIAGTLDRLSSQAQWAVATLGYAQRDQKMPEKGTIASLFSTPEFCQTTFDDVVRHVSGMLRGFVPQGQESAAAR